MAEGDEENKSLVVSDLDDYSLESTKEFVEWFNRVVNDLAVDSATMIVEDEADFDDEEVESE